MDELELNPAGVDPGAQIGEESTTRAASSPLGTQDSSVIVGLDGRERDVEALALARSLQASLQGAGSC